MPKLMRCLYCGLLQDEPAGVKVCPRCGGELAFELPPPPQQAGSYLEAQMELDQVSAPAGRPVDRHLLVTLRTPVTVPDDQAAPTGRTRPAIHLTAVVDVSGSMRGRKLDQVKVALRQALRHLSEGDWLSLVTFAQDTRRVLKPVRIHGGMHDTVDQAVQALRAGGQTALCAGLELGIRVAGSKRCDTNLVLLLSDGQANVGETDLEAVGLRAYQARQKDITVSTLGVGMDYNEALMVEIATQGGGRYYHVRDASQIVPYLTGELGEASNLAARGTTLHIDVPEGAIVVPLSASYRVELSDRVARVAVGDIACDVDMEVSMRLTLRGEQADARVSIEGEVHYESPAGHSLAARLNRVTVRFVGDSLFELGEGVAAPVAAKIARHLHAAQVLDISRTMTKDRAMGRQKAARGRDALHEYAERLGKEEADKIMDELGMAYENMTSSPARAKQAVAFSYRVSRSTKDFDKK
jgi:Ca-activated chloride channel family protein